MSEEHVWFPLATVDGALSMLAAHRERVRDLVHLHAGDDEQPVRDVLLAEVFALDSLLKRMRTRLNEPESVGRVGESARRIGEDTRERAGVHRAVVSEETLGRVGEDTRDWLVEGKKPMPRNRGQW